MIVWIASYPRSGNRLCRSTLRHGFRAGPMGFPTGEESLRKNLGPMLDELGVGPDDDALAALRVCEKPVYLKTHRLPDQIHYVPERGKKKAGSNGEIPPGKDESPALYIVRDGRDAIVSFAHYLKEVRGRPKLQSMSIEEVIADLVRREAPYGGWSGNVGAWRRRTAPTAMIRFEELAADPVAAIDQAADSLDLELPKPRGVLSFNVLRAGSPNPTIMRSGRSGSWKSEFPPELLDEFWRRHGAEMDAFGYSRE